jgi:hypothetical protein
MTPVRVEGLTSARKKQMVLLTLSGTFCHCQGLGIGCISPAMDGWFQVVVENVDTKIFHGYLPMRLGLSL